MSLQRRLVAIVALLLVVGLVVADVVTYASVHSFLYGQADNTLAQNESLGFNYVTYAAEPRPAGQPDQPVAARLGRRLRAAGRHNHQVILTRPSGPIEHPDPAPVLIKNIPVQQVPDIGAAAASAGSPARSGPTPTPSCSRAPAILTASTAPWR